MCRFWFSCVILGILLLHLHAEESNILKDPLMPTSSQAAANETIVEAVPQAGSNETIDEAAKLKEKAQREQEKNLLYLRIHKVMPGDPYYGIFNGNETEARRFANMIWRRLFARYENIAY